MLGHWAASRKEALKILTTLSLDAVETYTSNNDFSKMEIIYNKLLDEEAEAELHMVKTFFQRVTNVVFFLDENDLDASGKCATKGEPKLAMNKIILECSEKGIQMYAKKARTKKMAKSLANLTGEKKAPDNRSKEQQEVDKGEYNDAFNKLSETQKTDPELAKKAQDAMDAVLNGEVVQVGVTATTNIGEAPSLLENIFQDDEANKLFNQIVGDLKDIDSCGTAHSTGSKKVEAVQKLRSSLRGYAQQTSSMKNTFKDVINAMANRLKNAA